MSGFWQITGTTSVTQNAPGSAAVAGEQLRIRAIASSATASGALTVTDSIAGVIFQSTGAAFALSGLDIRGSVGGNLTVAQANGNGLNVQGDYVPQGYPYGLT